MTRTLRRFNVYSDNPGMMAGVITNRYPTAELTRLLICKENI
jgi:hypothetical protein